MRPWPARPITPDEAERLLSLLLEIRDAEGLAGALRALIAWRGRERSLANDNLGVQLLRDEGEQGGVMTERPGEEEMLIAMGRVTVAFSYLEYVVCTMVWALLSVKDHRVYHAVTAGEPWNRLVTLAKALARATLPPEALQEIADALGRADTVVGRRNEVVHSWWWQELDWDGPVRSDLAFQVRMRRPDRKGERRISSRTWSATEIDAIATALHDCGAELGILGQRHGLKTPPALDLD